MIVPHVKLKKQSTHNKPTNQHLKVLAILVFFVRCYNSWGCVFFFLTGVVVLNVDSLVYKQKK